MWCKVMYPFTVFSRRATGRKREREIGRKEGGGGEKKHARTWSSRKVCVDIRMAHVDVTYVLYMRM